jgi:hypothetical protein
MHSASTNGFAGAAMSGLWDRGVEFGDCQGESPYESDSEFLVLVFSLICKAFAFNCAASFSSASA